jgi:prepilin-type N-terminal cleavage/methylation domain-containing protein
MTGHVKETRTKKGFTIIEVALVLAVAALIFLVVFLAVPALQRNQRDDARKRDVANVAQATINWMAHSQEVNSLRYGSGTYAGHIMFSPSRTKWLWEGPNQRFGYNDYDKGAKCSDLGKYIDNLSGNIDYVGIVSVKDGTATFDAGHDIAGVNTFAGRCDVIATQAYTNAIVIYIGSKCNGNTSVEKATKKSAAIVVQIETGGKGKYYCQNAS